MSMKLEAFEVLAGSSVGEWTERQMAYDLIERLDEVIANNNGGLVKGLYKQLAKATDNDEDEMQRIQLGVTEELHFFAEIPAFCYIQLHAGEWVVLPDTPYMIESDYTSEVDEVPEKHAGEFVFTVNDHGNVSLYQWEMDVAQTVDSLTMQGEYKEVWSVV